MPVIKYKDPQTSEWVALGSGVLGTEIPFSENTPENDNAWIDPVSESLKYKDPTSGEVKKAGVSKSEVYSKEETDTLLAGKAPAGYGLGENSTYANLISDCNQATKNGWYWTYENVQNAPMDYGLLHVCCNSSYIKQEWWDTGTENVRMAIRVCNGGTWMPWEWVNPLMSVGPEYRTIERYQGKPVYCMTKFVGEVAADTVTQVIFDSSDIGEYCIRAFCTGKRTFRNWENDTTTMISSPAGSDTIITCDPTIYRLNEGNRSIRAYIKSSANLKDVYCTAYYTKWAD